MTRLVHSENGFLRSLEISANNFFMFVEGGLDRSFCDRLLRLQFNQSTVRHQVIAAKELPESTGGKPTLIKLFKQLRSKGKLVSNAFGKKFVCLFFFDKDIDDLRRRKFRSDHCVYTSTYDLEGHLFSCGDLYRAIADACGITFVQASSLISDQTIWIRDCVSRWKDWITLCVISQLRSTNIGCTYDRNSAINPNLVSQTDLASLKEYQIKLQASLNLDAESFKRLYEIYEKKVQKSIADGRPLLLFKGKWLKTLIEIDLRSRNQVADANLNSAGDRVVSTLVAQVGNHELCVCCESFLPQIKRVALQLNEV
jgi:hypothetical protein